MVAGVGNLIRNQKGLSLIEMLVSLAVLSLFVVVVIQLVGFNLTSTIITGEKGQANAAAQRALERITAMVDNSVPLTEITEMTDPEYVDLDEIYTYTQDLKPRFFVESTSNQVGEETVNGYEVTVVVFYRNGQAYIELPRFIEFNND
jgi:prepilin-type N-terminal cleavage/methylation domain-containing protein